MNIRKNIDYSDLYMNLTRVLEGNLEQMELYAEVGRFVAIRSEKGAAVAASDFIQNMYPEKTGFSARNVRRMRDFYLAYQNDQEGMQLAMNLNWTQNVVILEDCEPENRTWYLYAAKQNGWTKAQLVEAIKQELCQGGSVDNSGKVRYTNASTLKETSNDKATVCESREYLPESDCRVRDEKFGGESRAERQSPDRVRCYQPRRYWETRIYACQSNADETRTILPRAENPSTGKSRLRKFRFADWHGSEELTRYVSDLRRGLCREDASITGLHGHPWQHRRSMVFGRFCDLLDGNSKRLPRTA